MAILSLFASATRAEPARDGVLDPSFGQQGWVGFEAVGAAATRFDARWRLRMSLALDGSIYVVGTVSGAAAAPYRSRPAIVHVTSQGVLDSGYGDGGMLVLPTMPALDPAGVQASDATLLPDGRLVIVGEKLRPTNGSESCTQILALLPNGQVDPSYGPGPGPGCAYLGDPSVGPNSGIFVSARATASGTTWILGPTRNAQGLQTGLARLDVVGRVDRAFGANGVATTPNYVAPYNYYNLAIAPHANGSVSVLASTYVPAASWGPVHVRTSGLLDPMYGASGYAAALTHPYYGSPPLPPNHASAIRLDRHGRLWISGLMYVNGWPIEPDVLICDYCVARLGADGRLDATFNAGGAQPGTPGAVHYRWRYTNSVLDAVVRTVLPRADGGAVLAGRAPAVTEPSTRWGFGLVALRQAGELDATFGDSDTPGHIVHSPFGSPQYSVDMLAAERDRAGRITMLGDCHEVGCATGNCGFVCLARAFGDELLVDGFEQ
jgi:uncharacterized delta-60 repeat protein